VFFSLIMLTVSWWVFRDPQSVQVGKDTPEALKFANGVEPGSKTPQAIWTNTDVLLTALRVNLPMIALPLGENATPSDEVSQLGIRYRTFAAIASFLGWIVVPLFLAGVSGLVKKKQ
jgi:hypothetical protein